MKKQTRLLAYMLSIFLLLFSLPLEPLFVEAESGTDNVTTFSYTGGVQAYVIPKDGLYRLEVYGASGGIGGEGSFGKGLGGYASGYVLLRKKEVLYICCGGQGVTTGDGNVRWQDGKWSGGSYNGGGYAYDKNSAASYGTGGGATHIAKVGGTLESIGYASSVQLGRLYLCAGGGGGGYGGSNNGDLWGAASGGSGYTDGTPSFVYQGLTFSPDSSSGVNSGNGYARITFVARILSVTLPDYASYTDQDHYSISAPVSDTISFKWQIANETGDWADLYDSETGILTANIPEGFEDVSFTESIHDRTGTITISGTVTPEFDRKKLRAIVTDEDGETASSESILQVTTVERSCRSVVGQIGESADFSFAVHGAKSAALQICAYGTDTWETYVPAVGVVNNPITPTVRDGEVTFHFDSLAEDDIKKYYRIVLTNDGSGLISEEILLTSCLYNLYYDAGAVENLYYDEEEINAVYYNTGTDWVLIYGFE